MKLTILLAMACLWALAADKKPPRQITPEEARAAYNVSVNQITRMLKAPATARFAPFEDTQITPGGALNRKDIVVRLYVDAQNSYGALLRGWWKCWVGPQRPDGLYKVFCNDR